MKRNQIEAAWGAGWFACVVLGLTACGPQVYYPANPNANNDQQGPSAGSNGFSPGNGGGALPSNNRQTMLDAGWDDEPEPEWDDDDDDDRDEGRIDEDEAADEDADLDEAPPEDDDDELDEEVDEAPPLEDAGIGDEPDDRAAGGDGDCDELRTLARRYSADYCDSCHETSTRWNYGWDVQRMVDDKYLVPGDAEGSNFVMRVLSDSMPPPGVPSRPEEEETAAFMQWVDECL